MYTKPKTQTHKWQNKQSGNVLFFPLSTSVFIQLFWLFICFIAYGFICMVVYPLWQLIVLYSKKKERRVTTDFPDRLNDNGNM